MTVDSGAAFSPSNGKSRDKKGASVAGFESLEGLFFAGLRTAVKVVIGTIL
jgi:hypothetical protein